MWTTAILLMSLGPSEEVQPHPSIPANPLAQGVADEYRVRFLRGLEQAEVFRGSLVEPLLAGESQAYRLGELIERFRELARKELAGRPGLDRFSIGPDDFAARVRGLGQEAIDPAGAFGPFAGRWYGLWETNRVDHDWSQAVRLDLPTAGFEGHRLRIRATQSAWIGDGFGWNVVANPESGGEVILGTVYHVEPGRSDRVRLHRPHVGVDAGPGLLIWVTASEVFLEEVFAADDQRYVITGFRYELRGEELKFTGAAFQAVYTRHAEVRPAWYSFSIRGSEDRTSPAPSGGGAR